MQAHSAVIGLRGPSSRGGSRVTLYHISEHATSKRAGQGENILHAWLVVPLQTVQDRILSIFCLMKTLVPLMCCTSARLTAGTEKAAPANAGEPPPPPSAPPCAGVIHLSSFGDFPAVIPRWSLTCISVSLHFSFSSARGYSWRHLGSFTAPLGGRRKWRLT